MVFCLSLLSLSILLLFSYSFVNLSKDMMSPLIDLPVLIGGYRICLDDNDIVCWIWLGVCYLILLRVLLLASTSAVHAYHLKGVWRSTIFYNIQNKFNSTNLGIFSKHFVFVFRVELFNFFLKQKVYYFKNILNVCFGWDFTLIFPISFIN